MNADFFLGIKFPENKKVPSTGFPVLETNKLIRGATQIDNQSTFHIPTYTPQWERVRNPSVPTAIVQNCPQKSIQLTTPYRNPTTCGSL